MKRKHDGISLEFVSIDFLEPSVKEMIEASNASDDPLAFRRQVMLECMQVIYCFYLRTE